ncbi:uncharacterized protein LOC135076197 isoform X1 [Ostrinia nubilalis]|uniref:uncharacterized protein LOC135076197 isoform X1 n=1 Tax=Ostrinia nubilalis TaxID=29057 RepID=UPI0030826613
MHSFKYYATILLCVLLQTRGDKWYSATIINKQEMRDFEKDSFTKEARHMPSKLKHDHEAPRNMQPNSTRKQIRSPELFGSSNLHVTSEYYSPVGNSTRRPVEVIHYNNTINVVNIMRRIKPKKKIVKRCPSVPSRQAKKLAGNQAARTKFLEVFEVVEFEHVTCISSSGLEGTCLHEYECQSNGGSTMGTCADGYGTCCVTLFSCDGKSSEPVGWFTNPGFPTPSADRISCTFTLNKASDDITQIRLDFATFELLGPTAGTCQQDQFVVSGQNTNSYVPILCGINTGQHVFIEVGDTDGPIYLSVQTASPESRLYSIKVTQLGSADELTAPTGCLQYYTEPQGFLESFNFRDRSEIGIPRAPSYLNNLNYAMCIRRAAETCSVTYTNVDYMQIVNYDLDGLPVIPHGQAGVEIFNCPSDWLLISATRLCGDRLNDGAVLQDFSLDAPVTDSNAGPIAIWFRSDEGYVGRGFKLEYLQNTCKGPP